MRRDENAETVLIRTFGKPTPKQAEFLHAKTRFVGYGGAKGGGKSHAIRAKAAYLAFEYPGIQMLIVRRSFPQLHENHTKQLRVAFSRFPEHLRPKYQENDKAFLFPWGLGLSSGIVPTKTMCCSIRGRNTMCCFLMRPRS